MNDDLNPIFQDILKNVMPEQKKEDKVLDCVAESKQFFEDIESNTDLDDLFNLREQLFSLRKAIKKFPNEITKVIDDIQGLVDEKLTEADICPHCGADLELEEDSKYDTYVPYGNGMVRESRGGYMKCPECGFIKED